MLLRVQKFRPQSDAESLTRSAVLIEKVRRKEPIILLHSTLHFLGYHNVKNSLANKCTQ